jgi:hypothetical protein
MYMFPNLVAFELCVTEMFLFLCLISLIFLACAFWTKMRSPHLMFETPYSMACGDVLLVTVARRGI